MKEVSLSFKIDVENPAQLQALGGIIDLLSKCNVPVSPVPTTANAAKPVRGGAKKTEKEATFADRRVELLRIAQNKINIGDNLQSIRDKLAELGERAVATVSEENFETICDFLNSLPS